MFQVCCVIPESHCHKMINTPPPLQQNVKNIKAFATCMFLCSLLWPSWSPIMNILSNKSNSRQQFQATQSIKFYETERRAEIVKHLSIQIFLLTLAPKHSLLKIWLSTSSFILHILLSCINILTMQSLMISSAYTYFTNLTVNCVTLHTPSVQNTAAHTVYYIPSHSSGC